MGNYTVIADASEAILRILKEALVPDVIPDLNGIGLCSPQDSGEYTLGVFLYDIQESDEIRQFHMQDLDEKRQQGPPVFLSLYYMITAYSQSDPKFRMIQEERILGRVIQSFHDAPVLEAAEEEIRLQLMKLSTEDKTKLWNFSGKPYTVSVFYKAAPVRLDSAAVREVSRVRRTDFNTAPFQDQGRKAKEREAGEKEP